MGFNNWEDAQQLAAFQKDHEVSVTAFGFDSPDSPENTPNDAFLGVMRNVNTLISATVDLIPTSSKLSINFSVLRWFSRLLFFSRE